MAASKKPSKVYDFNYVVTPRGVTSLGISAVKAIEILYDLNLRGVPAAVVRSLYTSDAQSEQYVLFEHVIEYNPIGVAHPALITALTHHMPARRYLPGTQYIFQKVGPALRKAPPGRKASKRRPRLDDSKMGPELRAHLAKQPAQGAKTVGDVLASIKKKKLPAPCQPNFFRGLKEVITQKALHSLHPIDVTRGMVRFKACDWGDVDGAQTRENNRHTHSRRGPIRGAYRATQNGVEFWIIASPPENALVVLLPEDN